nr:hypothetical protein B0A51_03142 [Rachicladosporium sp. CCFEE 5018]
MSLSPPHPTTQSLSLSFTLPSRHKTHLTITTHPNISPSTVGHPLLFPTKAFPREVYLDFPVTTAKLHCTEDVGYAVTYGWIQFIYQDFKGSEVETKWEHDPLPITDGSRSPFIWFGPEAQLFDAPFRSDRSEELDWTCHSFLAYLEDAVMTKSIKPVLGFEWGYVMNGGKVTVKELKLLDVGPTWEKQRGLLEGKFGEWKYETFDGKTDVVMGEAT